MFTLLSLHRLYITQHFAAYHGWPDTRVLLQLANCSFEKMNTMYYIPNAINIKDKSGEDFFFGSLVSFELPTFLILVYTSFRCILLYLRLK